MNERGATKGLSSGEWCASAISEGPKVLDRAQFAFVPLWMMNCDAVVRLNWAVAGSNAVVNDSALTRGIARMLHWYGIARVVVGHWHRESIRAAATGLRPQMCRART